MDHNYVYITYCVDAHNIKDILLSLSMNWFLNIIPINYFGEWEPTFRTWTTIMQIFSGNQQSYQKNLIRQSRYHVKCLLFNEIQWCHRKWIPLKQTINVSLINPPAADPYCRLFGNIMLGTRHNNITLIIGNRWQFLWSIRFGFFC